MFSIVIPLYNKEKSIQATLKSVLNQTFQDFELIIIDDGSTDESLNAVKKFHDDRLKIYTKENGGVSSARNKGISVSNFEWIALLDADDLWEPNHLEMIVFLINENLDKKVFTTSWSYERLNQNDPCKSKIDFYTIDNYFKAAYKRNIICSSTAVVNTGCFKKIGYFNTLISRGEDLEFWARLARDYYFVKTDKVTATYRLEAENRSFTNNYPITSSFVYYIRLESSVSWERKYYLQLIRKKIFSSAKRLNFRAIFLLINKYGSNLFSFK